MQVRIVQVLHQDYRVETQQLAILTPYSAQKSMIKKKLQQHGRLKEIKVSTITESQGKQMRHDNIFFQKSMIW